MLFRRRPFRARIFFAAAGIAALFIVTIVIAPQWLARQARLEVLRMHVGEIAQLAASAVDGALHRQLLEPGRYSTDLYNQALAPLVRFHSAMPEAFYVYTMAERDGQTWFILDTAASTDLISRNKLRASAYMERFELRPEYEDGWLKEIASGHTYVTPTFQIDDYGYFLTGHAPILDSQGRYSGFAGVDFDLAYYLAQEARFYAIGIGSLVATLVTSLLFGFFVARYHFDLHYQMERHYHSSIRDELTGLLNRRGALEAVARAPRQRNSSQAALLLDVDGLKTINDTRGHAAGDAVLTRLAATILESVRNDDIAARIGGDEFLIVAPNCNLEVAELIGRHVLERFAEPMSNPSDCSVSIGISIEGADEADFDGMYKRADEALYRAKSGGKNRSAVYGRT